MTRALIVEDSPTQAQQLAFLLTGEGFEVEVATDGFRGMELCRGGGFDVVLSDVVMPRLDGYELCRRLKADERTRSVPVILLTSLSEPTDIISGLECGADNFITKPYDAAYLVGRVRQLLETRDARAGQKAARGVEVMLMGRRFTVDCHKEQALDLLVSTFEEVMRSRQREYDARLGAESVRASQRFLQTALDALSTAIAIVDDQGIIRAVNAPWRRLAEQSRAGLEGAGVGAPYLEVWATLFVGAEARLGEIAVGLAAVTERASFQVELSVRLAGASRVFALRASRFDGTGPRLIAVEHEDVTERREAERALRRVEEQLRHSQKMEAIGQLAGGVAHDFNNLLAVMCSYAELAVQAIRPGDPVREDIEEIRRAAGRGAALTRQLLAFSRRQVLKPVVLDLNQVVREVQKMLRRVIGANVRLDVALDPRLSRTRVDRGQVEQILLNLAVNARDAMPEGGQLAIETRNVVDASRADGHPELSPGTHAVLSVTDTGVGMTREVQARIFEPFFTTKDIGKGTGLGLSTVFGIVQQSGGHVFVTSEPGRGARFDVYLPASEEGPASTERPSRRLRRASRTATVLLVEDDAAVRQVATRILREGGLTVLDADGPEAARALCRTHTGPVDVLLADLVLPGVSGPDLATELGAARPEMRIVHMSGYAGTSASIERVLSTGAAFLEKPFTPVTLLNKIREALNP